MTSDGCYNIVPFPHCVQGVYSVICTEETVAGDEVVNMVLSVEGLGCTLNRVVNNNPLHADRRRISSLTAEAINSA